MGAPANLRKLAVAGLLIGLAALGVAHARRPEPAQPPVQASAPPVVHAILEREPNDGSARAQTIALPAVVTGEASAGDADWFRVSVGEQGGWLLDAWTDAQSARLQVVGGDGKPLATVASPARIGALGVVRGDYWLKVDGPAGRYRLHVAASPWSRGLDWEPDDDAEHAQELAKVAPGAGELARWRAVGWWSRQGDKDCYRVPLAVPAAGADLRLELAAPAGVAPRVSVHDAGDAKTHTPSQGLATATGAAGGQAIIPALGERSWESAYFICVDAAAGDSFGERYTLDVWSFTPAGAFEFEPNDTRQSASALPRGTTIEGYLAPGDTDWYRVSAGRSAQAVCHLVPPPNVAPEVALFDDNGRELVRERGAAGQPLSATASQPAFAEVHALTGGNVSERYRLSCLESSK